MAVPLRGNPIASRSAAMADAAATVVLQRHPEVLPVDRFPPAGQAGRPEAAPVGKAVQRANPYGRSMAYGTEAMEGAEAVRSAETVQAATGEELEAKPTAAPEVEVVSQGRTLVIQETQLREIVVAVVSSMAANCLWKK